MGESERYQDYKHLRSKRKFPFFREGSSVMSMFVVNAVFFLLLLFLQVGFFYAGSNLDKFREQILSSLSLPVDFSTFFNKPWTILTFMFTESGAGFFRLLGNMLWLWAFGSIMQEVMGNKHVIPVYVYGGILGGAVFMTSGTWYMHQGAFLSGMQVMGANMPVIAIAAAATVFDPRYRIFPQIRNGIPVWVLTSIYLILDIIDIAQIHPIFAAAHLGAALAGALYVLSLKKGLDLGGWMQNLFEKFNHLFSPAPYKKPGKEKQVLFYEKGNREPFSRQANLTQQRIDEILEKIHQSGYGSLSEEEKEILKKAADTDL